MVHAYILKNQHDLFLDKHGQWVDQADAIQLYRTLHKDEAINCMVEYSVKNPDLRIKVETCAVNAKGHLVLAGAELDVEAPSEAAVETTDAPAEAIDQSEPHLFAANEQSSNDSNHDTTSGA